MADLDRKALGRALVAALVAGDFEAYRKVMVKLDQMEDPRCAKYGDGFDRCLLDAGHEGPCAASLRNVPGIGEEEVGRG